MKKVLLAFDGNNCSGSIIEFLKLLHRHQPVFAVGFFLPAVGYSELLYSFGGVPSGPMYITEATPGNAEIVKENIDNFKALCEENNISHAIYNEETKHILTVIEEESRCADLLLIDGGTFYRNLGSETQHEYITDALHRSECPVMIVPPNFYQPQSLIFAYDGSKQSVFAIKQFNYLFPFYSELPAYIVYFSTRETDLPQRNSMEDLLKCHYSNVIITKLDIHRREDIEDWLLKNNSPVFITGSYGRSSLSEFIRHSFATNLLTNNKLYVFVAHK